MYRVVKTLRVPIGHRLLKHKGLCKNVHGHNIKVEVAVSSSKLDENGMVIDFSELKKMILAYLDPLDHSLILNSSDPLVHEMEKVCNVTVFQDLEPTAENLSKYLFDHIKNAATYKGLRVDFVRIWENDDSYAEYSGNME